MLLRVLMLVWLSAGCGIGWWSANRTLSESQESVPAESKPIQEPVVQPAQATAPAKPSEPSEQQADANQAGVKPASSEQTPLSADRVEPAKPNQPETVKEPPRETPPVRRAKRPQFSQRDWDGIYFENLFRDGLVGQRPQPGAAKPIARPAIAANPEPAKPVAPPGETAGEPASAGWSGLVAGESLETAVKRLLLKLEQEITTPVKFKTDYLKVRQSYSLLSMWFAVILEYEGEVRWKQAAALVQPACWRAAANARTDGEQAYQYARLRKDELQELVRGGSFAETEKPIEEVDWSQVIDRVPTMLQLDESLKQLKELTASKGEFEGGVEDVLQQASVIAVIGRVLAQESMEGGDDADYRGQAGEMTTNASNLLQACKLSDFDSAAKAVNLIEQSCNRCHEDWR